MLKPSDLLTRRLPLEMMHAAVCLALRGITLSSTNNFQNEIAFSIQRVVDYTSLLAFRRCLSDRKLSYSSWQSSPFTDPDRQNLILGGRRCIIDTELVRKKEDIRALRKNPEKILEKAVCFPESPENIWEEDLLLFAFMSGLLARNPSDIHKAFQARQPLCLVHILPAQRRSLKPWSSLGSLSLKSDAKRTLHIEFGGLRKDRTYQSEKVSLPPGEVVRFEPNFYSLTYLKVEEPIFERLALRSPLFPYAYMVHPHQWHNLWVYGLEITFTGYMTWSEFRLAAYPSSENENFTPFLSKVGGLICLPVEELYPLGPLFKQIANKGF
jgi:hypothetical protein